MKRASGFFEKIIDKENIKEAHLKARRGKSHYDEVKFVNKNMDKCITDIHESLTNKSFTCSEYSVFKKQCGTKIRDIYKLPYYPDRIVHHAIMNVLEPHWEKALIRDTYSSIKCRGIHDGVRRIKRALKDVEGTRYCLKMDIKKFYPSVDNDILKLIIGKKIKDRDVIELLNTIIDKEQGLPIGNLLSQVFGNLYLTYFDHYCKEELKAKHYCRYCDDIVVLSDSKEYLHNLFTKADRYLKDELKLTVKDNYQVFPVASRGIDFLGYVFFHTHTRLRKSIKGNMIKAVSKGNTKAFASYHGWMKHADCHNLQKKYFYESAICN